MDIKIEEEWSDLEEVVSFARTLAQDKVMLYAFIAYVCFRFCCCCRWSWEAEHCRSSSDPAIKIPGDPQPAGTPLPAIIAPCPSSYIKIDTDEQESYQHSGGPAPLCVYGAVTTTATPPT